MAQASTAPVAFDVQHPEKLSRLMLLLKSFLGWLYVGIPHGIILYVYGILTNLVTLIAFLAILITGRYPLGLFNFVVGYYRWGARVTAYLSLMTDKYPPFSRTTAMWQSADPVTLQVPYPERLSRWRVLLKLFLGWLYVGIPHGFVLFFYGIAVLGVLFVAWWAILFTSRFPLGLFNFVVRYFRWSARVQVYLALLRDEYPPFNGRPQPPPPLAGPGLISEPQAAPDA